MPDHQTAPPSNLFSLEAVQLAFVTPWKARLVLSRLLTLPYQRVSFWLAGVAWGKQWQLYGTPIIQKHRDSIMQIGDALELRSSVNSNPLGPTHPVIFSTRRPNTSLTIGHHFGMTGGSIIVEEQITIGNFVTVGANCTIMDTDFHPLNAERRKVAVLDGATAPVTIEDNVFIGMNSLILKGVTLHQGCVIGAGSVVTRDVPAGMIAAGNPARVIKAVEG
jgi:acetyltransferase-like isoleucine patch superfamily enzyme